MGPALGASSTLPSAFQEAPPCPAGGSEWAVGLGNAPRRDAKQGCQKGERTKHGVLIGSKITPYLYNTHNIMRDFRLVIDESQCFRQEKPRFEVNQG